MKTKEYVLVRVDGHLCLITTDVIEKKSVGETMLFYLLSSNPYKDYKSRISLYHDKALAYAWGTLISATPFIVCKHDDYYINQCVVIKEQCTIEEYKKRIKEEFLLER